MLLLCSILFYIHQMCIIYVYKKYAWTPADRGVGHTGQEAKKRAEMTLANMYTCMCVYVYIYIYIHTYVYITIYIYIHIFIYTEMSRDTRRDDTGKRAIRAD